MRRFLAGLLLGVASMYWYTYQKDAFMEEVKQWFADASSDPEAEAKINKMFSGKKKR
jgi:hypothetical protein